MSDLTTELRGMVGPTSGGWHALTILAAADRIDELEKTVVEAIAELRAEHFGATVDTSPRGCVVCYPADSSWPCVSRMIADDLAALLPDPEEATP